jgi:hypothetical protein
MKTIYAADLFCGAGGTSTGLTQAAEKLGLVVQTRGGKRFVVKGKRLVGIGG